MFGAFSGISPGVKKQYYCNYIITWHHILPLAVKQTMKPLSQFNIILIVISTLLVITGSLLIDRTKSAYYILYLGLFMAIVFSISSVVDVFKAKDISNGRRMIWIILTISVPVLGGLLFYVINHGKTKQVSQG